MTGTVNHTQAGRSSFGELLPWLCAVLVILVIKRENTTCDSSVGVGRAPGRGPGADSESDSDSVSESARDEARRPGGARGAARARASVT